MCEPMTRLFAGVALGFLAHADHAWSVFVLVRLVLLVPFCAAHYPRLADRCSVWFLGTTSQQFLRFRAARLAV